MEKREALKSLDDLPRHSRVFALVDWDVHCAFGRADVGAFFRQRSAARRVYPGILVFFIGGALALFALRAKTLKPGGFFAPVSREGSLVLNNLVLTTCCATVFVGTLYPLALQSFTGEKISVGAPFFNATVVPLFLPLVLLMPVGQNLAWKRGDFLGAAQRLYFALLCGLAMVLVLAGWHHNGPLASISSAGSASM